MSANDGNEPDIDMDKDSDREVGKIMEAAAIALEPPAGARVRVYRNVLREYERVVDETLLTSRQAHRTGSLNKLTGWALAASMLMAISAVYWISHRDHAAPQPNYWIARISSGALLLPQNAGAAGSTLRLVPGFHLTTGSASPAELQLSDATRLRLDRASELLVQGPTSFQLTRGSVYVDNADPATHIQIESRGGTVTEIGTQYAVRLKSDSTEVAVREGRIELRTRDGALLQSTASAVEGELMRVSDEGGVSRVALRKTDIWWSWAAAAAAPFVIENASVDQYLQWACREHGLTLRYSSDIVAVQARQSRLQSTEQGQSIPLPPIDSLANLLDLTQYAGQRIDDTLEVDFRR